MIEVFKLFPILDFIGDEALPNLIFSLLFLFLHLSIVLILAAQYVVFSIAYKKQLSIGAWSFSQKATSRITKDTVFAKLEDLTSLIIQVYPYIIMVPVFDLSMRCIFTQGGPTYLTVFGVVNGILGLAVGLIQAFHDIDYKFKNEDFLKRRDSLQIYIMLIETLVMAILNKL